MGGSKKEKAEIGLVRLSKKFKYIVPSGILLNTILKSNGLKIGQSKIFDYKTKKLVDNFLKRYRSKIILPDKIIVINSSSNQKKTISIKEVQKMT